MASIIDFDEIVRNWAIENIKTISKYDKELKKAVKLLRKNQLAFKIVWRDVKLESTAPKYSDRDKVVKPSCKVLFKSAFRNISQRDQQYTFQTERCTRSTCELSYERGVSLGVSMGIELSPPLCKTNVEFHCDLSVTESSSVELEEEMKWSIDNQITVSPNCACVAKLVIEEEQFESDFEITTTMEGTVYVIYTNTTDNSFVCKSGTNVSKLFKSQHVPAELKQRFTLDGDKVVVVSSGRVKFNYGVKQDVQIEEMALEDYNKMETTNNND